MQIFFSRLSPPSFFVQDLLCQNYRYLNYNNTYKKSCFQDKFTLHLHISLLLRHLLKESAMSRKYAYRYGEQLVFIKKVPLQLQDKDVFVYLCIGEDMYLMKHKKTILNALDKK